MLRWPILAGIVLLGVLAVIAIPDAPAGMSVSRLFYLGALDGLTVFLKDAPVNM